MQYRKLGKTGLSVSEIGYGGGRIKKDQGRKELIDLIHKALDQGINYIDTAPTYGDGFSETTIGEAIKGRSCIVATKTKAYNANNVTASVESSLKRLKVETIDVLQFHGGWFDSKETEEIFNRGGLETYLKLKESGKVRYLGFSADGPSSGVDRLITSGEFDMMQIHYNLMYQSTCDLFSNRGVIPDAHKHEMGIVLMRSTTSHAFTKLMRQCFPEQTKTLELNTFLLNYVLSNPLVDVALMSLQSIEDVEWTNTVSDRISDRLDLQAFH